MVSDRGFDGLAIKQQLRFVLGQAQRGIRYKIEDCVDSIRGVLRITPPSLTERFLQSGDPNAIFSNETIRSGYKNGVVTYEIQPHTRAQFVAHVVTPLEKRHRMSSDEFIKKYERAQLNIDTNAGEYVLWAGLCYVMNRDTRKQVTQS